MSEYCVYVVRSTTVQSQKNRRNIKFKTIKKHSPARLPCLMGPSTCCCFCCWWFLKRIAVVMRWDEGLCVMGLMIDGDDYLLYTDAEWLWHNHTRGFNEGGLKRDSWIPFSYSESDYSGVIITTFERLFDLQKIDKLTHKKRLESKITQIFWSDNRVVWCLNCPFQFDWCRKKNLREKKFRLKIS